MPDQMTDHAPAHIRNITDTLAQVFVVYFEEGLDIFFQYLRKDIFGAQLFFFDALTPLR